MEKLLDWYKKEVPYPLAPHHQSKQTTSLEMINGVAYWIGTKWVYVIKNESNCLFKIGHTGNLRERLRHIRCACGSEVSVYFAIELSDRDEDCTVLEAALHKYFKDKRQPGEWFKLNKSDLKQINALFWEIEGEAIFDQDHPFYYGLKYL